nr:L565 [uncultured bacterium]
MGGYTGDQQASLIKEENAWVVLDIDELSHEMCLNIMKKVSDK